MSGAGNFRTTAVVSFCFFGIGAVCLAVTVSWLAWQPGVFLDSPWAASVVTLVHLVVLGWMGSFVFGAAYQLIPVISEGALWSRAMAWAHLGAQGVGLPMLLFFMARGEFAGAGVAGSVVVAGAGMGVVNLVATATCRSRWTPENVGLQVALFWLLATVGMGVALALARSGRLPLLDADAVRRVHMVCGVTGFFAGVLLAVSFKLVPMFLLSAGGGRGRAWSALGLFNAGLVLMVPGLWARWHGLVVVAALVLAAGVAAFLAEMGIVVERRMRPLDWPLKCFLGGLAVLGPATVYALAGTLQFAGWVEGVPQHWERTVFALLVFGVVTPCILGMAGRIVPFLAWQWRYAPHVGRARVPLVAELVNVGVLRVQCVAALAGGVAIAVGANFESRAFLRLGACGYVIAVGCVAMTAGGLVPHLLHPRLTPLGGKAAAGGRVSL